MESLNFHIYNLYWERVIPSRNLTEFRHVPTTVVIFDWLLWYVGRRSLAEDLGNVDKVVLTVRVRLWYFIEDMDVKGRSAVEPKANDDT